MSEFHTAASNGDMSKYIIDTLQSKSFSNTLECFEIQVQARQIGFRDCAVEINYRVASLYL